MTHPRSREIIEGTLMVVTDLHGYGDVYEHLKRIFLDRRKHGTADRLVICGDLLHMPDPTDPADRSLAMLTDVMDLQADLGADTVILLCGNHEMPHIYGQPLLRGTTNMTSPFEAAVSASGRREEITRFLAELPFYVLTGAGVMLTHAGPTHEIAKPEAAAQLLNFDHNALLADLDREISRYDLPHTRSIYAAQHGDSYANLASDLIAADHESDPHYDHLLRAFFLSGNDAYDLLWEALFARNEGILPNDLRRATLYPAIVRNFLNAFSANVPALPQHIVVSGHITTQRGGHTIVEDHHLRLASYAHAKPSEKGKYLLLDAAGTYSTADDLVPYLHPVYP